MQRVRVATSVRSGDQDEFLACDGDDDDDDDDDDTGSQSMPVCWKVVWFGCDLYHTVHPRQSSAGSGDR